MRSVILEHFCVQLVQEKRQDDVPLYSIEVEGEGSLYSHVSFEAVMHYFEMLVHPADTGTVA
ncbi:hypothetical protein [Marinobacter bohaiensis]|uniref:hypothetical protein n=1 Tax=Marinobacter bohaiensis TaxID=2201898 RepID=UPI0013A6D8D0|nr:hypothetical protein [Marinobacter bohaiensis]